MFFNKKNPLQAQSTLVISQPPGLLTARFLTAFCYEIPDYDYK